MKTAQIIVNGHALTDIQAQAVQSAIAFLSRHLGSLNAEDNQMKRLAQAALEHCASIKKCLDKEHANQVPATATRPGTPVCPNVVINGQKLTDQQAALARMAVTDVLFHLQVPKEVKSELQNIWSIMVLPTVQAAPTPTLH